MNININIYRNGCITKKTQYINEFRKTNFICVQGRTIGAHYDPVPTHC